MFYCNIIYIIRLYFASYIIYHNWKITPEMKSNTLQAFTNRSFPKSVQFLFIQCHVISCKKTNKQKNREQKTT